MLKFVMIFKTKYKPMEKAYGIDSELISRTFWQFCRATLAYRKQLI